MERYSWHLLGLCETRWKDFGETTTDEGHLLFYSGETDTHRNGVGLLVHKDIKASVLGSRPISSRLISIRLSATPFNITVIQAYAPTSDYSDEDLEDFYSQVQDTIDKTPKKDIIILQGDWNAKIGVDAQKDWKGMCGTSCNSETNNRGQRLLEFASYNNFILANTLGQHKNSRKWTWHHPDGIHHNQIDYIMIARRFKSGIKQAKTRTFPGADVGSDHDLVMMNFRVRLKKIKRPQNPRIKFDLERLKDPEVAENFQAFIGGKFAPLLALDGDIETLTTEFSETMTEAAKETLGKHKKKLKPWVTKDILQQCDTRRELKKGKSSTDGAIKYREINTSIRKSMKEAREKWIEDQCTEIEECINSNNSKKAFQVVKDLTKKKTAKVSSIQDEAGNCLTEEKDIINRWTEYCSGLYNHPVNGDPEVLGITGPGEDDDFPILREEVEAAVKSLKNGKAPGIDNIPSELIKNGGSITIDVLTKICNKIWQTGQWPTTWTQSLVITLPKKGNLQQCSNYRTISLISHPSKVMLKVLLNRMKPQAENIIAEEQAGFREGRSTTEQIFNLRIISEKYQQHQRDLYHVFVDFKKAFDRVWHQALWNTMRKYNMGRKLVHSIEQLYANASSAILLNGNIGEWFRTTVGVRQGCLLSPTLFNVFLERIMTEALDQHEGTVSIGGRTITNLRFADDIDGLAGEEQELQDLVQRLDTTSSRFGMEISAEKTKLMTNTSQDLTSQINIGNQSVERVTQFKYLGAVISEEGSRPEIMARIAQTTAALARLKPVWRDQNITLKSKIRLMRALVISIFLYACETWTITAEIEKKVQAMEMRCYRKILGISYKDHITNDEVRQTIRQHIGPYEDLLATVKRRKLQWYGHITRSSGLAKTVLQGTVEGARRRGRQKKKWVDNIMEWTGNDFATTQAQARNRQTWRELSKRASRVVPRRPSGLRDP